MLKHILICLLFTILFSCKKDEIDIAPQFPADLYITNINKKFDIRLFVNKTEIKDQAVIDKFVRDEPRFHIKDSSVVSDEKITFLSADSATIQNLYNRLSIEKSGDKFLFKSVNKGTVSESWARLIYAMLKYKSELGTQWYDQNYRVDNLMVGYGDYSKIELSVFNYKIVKGYLIPDYYGMGEYLSISKNTGNIFNEFDESYIKSVGKLDTLAIEEYSYTFKVRK